MLIIFIPSFLPHANSLIFIEEQLDDVFEEQNGLDSIRYFEKLRDEMTKKGLTQEIMYDFLNDEY